MIDLRRLAVALIAVGLVLSTVYGSGAFDSLTASRDATVQVAGDAGGYLALAPADGPNGAYATQKNGQLRVSLAGALEEGASGSGVNPDAVTGVRKVFTITNQGTQPVGVWVTDESDRVAFEAGNGPIEKREWAATLGPGESRAIDIVVDTRGYTGDDAGLLESVTIHADTEAASDGDSGQSDGSSGQSPDTDPAPETGTNSETENDDATAEPPSTAGPPDLSPEMKDRIEEIRSEQEDDADDDDSDGGLVGTIGGVVGSVVNANGAVARHSGPAVKIGTKVVSRTAVTLTAGYMLFEHGVETAGSPSTSHGSLTMLALYPADTTDSELNEPIRLPSGAGGYEAPDGTDREFGRDQLVQLPGITNENARESVGEILKAPNEVREEGEYTVVVGDNPQGEGEITLWLYDGYVMKGTTEEMEVTKESEQTNQRDQRQQNEQREDSDSDQDPPSHSPDITRHLPDGGEQDTKNEHEAMNELRHKGIQTETVVDWSNQGYDVQAINEALDQYQNSGETLPEPRSQARGDLGEIVAKPTVMEMYPSSQGYEYTQGVELKSNDHPPDVTEIDWVVTDSETGDVVAVYQVKSGVGKDGGANDQLKESEGAFKDGDVDYLDEAPGLHKDDFTRNLNDIDRYTVGPQDDPDYDRRFDLTDDGLQALLDAIRRNNL